MRYLLPVLLFCSNAVAQEPYAEALKQIDTLMAQAQREKSLPALSIAIVEDQKILFMKGYGQADPKNRVPATEKTIYRVGSVSKLFTDIAIMQMVEQGKLDLDAPITDYLPKFGPKPTFDKKITLRQMMAHRSGLVREPPVGSYFHPESPSLEKVIESLHGTPHIYEPETKLKYSNAAIATVGYVLEKVGKKPFPNLVEDNVLKPLGMTSSSFEPKPELMKRLAEATMWTYHGRTFPAPKFELGEAPAGCMYSSVEDLAKFMSIVFADGRGPNGPILKPESLKQMLTPQFAKKDNPGQFGLGFMIGELDGKIRIGHGGAIYGFATELAFLPEEKLGVIVVASLDVANALTTHLADVTLSHLLAVRSKKPLPKIEKPEPLSLREARSLAGKYQAKDKFFELTELGGKLWIMPGRGGFRVELKSLGTDLIADDVTGIGTKIERIDGKFRIGKDEYVRVEVPLPPEPPQRWRGLIGEYGWDHNALYILEREGKLTALIEWFFLYPLTEESENVFAFPDYGLYHGEKLYFKRDANGKATQVEAASIVFERRKIDGEDGQTFRIKPVRPVAQLREIALKATPPKESGRKKPADLVELAKLDPTLKFDLRYATDNNFLGVTLYPKDAKAFMQRPAAEAVVRVHQAMEKQGYGLLIHDAYRPWYVTKMFRDATPPEQWLFVADPLEGSRHNRGCAVDLTLFDRKTGKVVEMVSGYDEFSDRSYPLYPGGTSRQRWLRTLLRQAMEKEGFDVYAAEWWHFDYRDWREYGIGNRTFEELQK